MNLMFGQDNAEAGALSWLALNVDSSLMLIHNPLHETEAKADTFNIFGARFVCSIKSFKNMW